MSEPKCREWLSTVFAAFLDVEEAAVWLQKNDDFSYSLPSFTVEGGLWEVSPAQVQARIEPALGLRGQVLYRADYREDSAACRADVVMVVEAELPMEKAGCWFPLQQLREISLADSRLGSLLERVLVELETGQVPMRRPPWARPGWLGEAAGWMAAELGKAGWTTAGPVEMIRSWALSYVMRVQAHNGNAAERAWFYFKTSIDLPLFVNEAVVTRELAALYPGHVPLPLALDGQKNWMLLPDFGPAVGHEAALEERLEILRQFAEMQKRSAEQVEELVAAGCCDRRRDWMVAEIEYLLTHPEVEKAVAGEEAAELRSMIAPLQAMCRRLFDYGVPEALIHGDLHGGNVSRNAAGLEQLLFFDWTDSAVSHPFFDMLLIYTVKDAAERDKMRDVYLSYWQDYEPMERLLEIWRLAELLAAVYHSISYLYIITGVEEWGKDELNWALPYWLGKILAYGEIIYES